MPAPTLARAGTAEESTWVTIVAALYEGPDSIVIGADSRVMESPGDIPTVNEHKLQRHSSGRLVWAYAGHDQAGDAFNAWLAALDWTALTQPVLIDAVQGKLADLNGARRAMLRRAGVEPEPAMCTDVLIVAWFETPLILVLDSDSGASIYREGEFAAIGSGKPHAFIACKTARALGMPISADMLRLSLHMAASLERQCGPPLHIWRVTGGAVDVLVTAAPAGPASPG